jgi:hypothetical protein
LSQKILCHSECSPARRDEMRNLQIRETEYRY